MHQTAGDSTDFHFGQSVFNLTQALVTLHSTMFLWYMKRDLEEVWGYQNMAELFALNN